MCVTLDLFEYDFELIHILDFNWKKYVEAVREKGEKDCEWLSA